MKPPKLGQHFLTDSGAVKKIVAALDIQTKETIIEIGPGKGFLTMPLAEACAKKDASLIAIERDEQLAKKLAARNNKHLTVDVGDALRRISSITELHKNYSLVGNIPYYISGKLFRLLADLDRKPRRVVVTVQQEVAERITATPPRMNLLAAILGIWFDARILLRLDADHFSPPPKVSSAVLVLDSKQDIPSLTYAHRYYEFVKMLFQQPRKTALNNLAAGFPEKSKEMLAEILKKSGAKMADRPGNLSIPIIKKLISCF